MKQRMKVSDKNTQIGIDIGTSKICCAITEINSDEGSNKILGVGKVPSQGIKKGSIVHRDRVMDAIEAAVREAELMASIKVNRALLSISGDHIRGINTQGAIAIQKGSARNVPMEQEITHNDVSRVLELAKAVSLPVDREILHILPQEYLIDTMDSIKDPVGMSGRRLEAKVHLITMAATTAKNLVNCVHELAIDVEGLVFQALASAIATLDTDEKELGVAVVDIGAGTTDITVFYDDGVRHSAVIGVGASMVTNDIAVMLQIGMEDAEQIKLKYASAKASMSSTELEFDLPVKNGGIARKVSEHELSRYVEARMIELIQLIGREIARADVSDQLTYGLVLTGGGAMLRNLVPLAQEKFNMPVRIGRPKNFSGAVDIASTADFTAAIGLTQWTSVTSDLVMQETGLSPIGKAVTNIKDWVRGLFT
jgi:cell division protein FtsA